MATGNPEVMEVAIQNIISASCTSGTISNLIENQLEGAVGGIEIGDKSSNCKEGTKSTRGLKRGLITPMKSPHRKSRIGGVKKMKCSQKMFSPITTRFKGNRMKNSSKDEMEIGKGGGDDWVCRKCKKDFEDTRPLMVQCDRCKDWVCSRCAKGKIANISKWTKGVQGLMWICVDCRGRSSKGRM